MTVNENRQYAIGDAEHGDALSFGKEVAPVALTVSLVNGYEMCSCFFIDGHSEILPSRSSLATDVAYFVTFVFVPSVATGEEEIIFTVVTGAGSVPASKLLEAARIGAARARVLRRE